MKNNYIFLRKLKINIKYQNGFLNGDSLLPFYSYIKFQNNNKLWSKEMDDFMHKCSKNHFVDIYNRILILKQLQNNLLDMKNNLYLDIGCSSGYLIDEIKKYFKNIDIIGSDYSEKALHYCHSRLPEIPLFQMDLVNCKFPDNCIDAITCLNVLEHISNDSKGLKQLYRILKPGGVLILSVPTGKKLYDIYDEISGHFRRYSLKELSSKMECIGFSIIRRNHFLAFVYPVFLIIKLINNMFYKTRSSDIKKKIAISEAEKLEKSFLGYFLCFLEYFYERYFELPFGVRAYICAKKL